jgi:hypothetical protein
MLVMGDEENQKNEKPFALVFAPAALLNLRFKAVTRRAPSGTSAWDAHTGAA